MAQVDFGTSESDPFVGQKPSFFGQAASKAGQGAVAADDAMAGDGGSIGVAVEGVADGAAAFCAKLLGDLAVSDDPASGNPGGEGPDLFVESHSLLDSAGTNVGCKGSVGFF